ncbi:L-type lectin-domain containing protein [Enterococcus quebecensis]|uniref:L-type lectin-domain containing protein n=1 Tax=Enterococcus quebecensis TaxID=903983 RepID=UPI00116018BC|nr:L-type lectin-domain containing protein [Enterococcus quebecensis]
MLPSQVEAASEIAPQSVPLDNIFTVPEGAHSTVRGNTVIITDAETNRVGSIFSTEANKVDLSKDFDAEMYINLEGEADGVAFVFHNDPDRVSYFTGAVGNAIGAYANAKQSYIETAWSGKKTLVEQLKNSFAIEFDTYYNGDSYDYDILRNLDGYGREKGHVAYAFPDNVDSYLFKSTPYNEFILDHAGLQYPDFSLGDGKWRLLKIHWTTWDRLGNGVLTYEYEGLQPVKATIPKSTFKFAQTGDEKVYWGFTGSTGALTEKAMVAFRSVPGLVNYEENIKFLNSKGLPANMDKAVGPNEELTVHYSGKYVGGLQNLLSPSLNLTLSQGQIYQSGSLTVNGKSVNPTILGDTLKITSSDLSLINSDLDVKFKVKNTGLMVTTDQSVKSQVTGANYISPDLQSLYKVDAIKPKGEGKHTIINYGDDKAITDVLDYTKFLKDWSDDITLKENVKVSLKANQDIQGLVSALGPDSFLLELTDEVGNKTDVTVPIFIKDSIDSVSPDNKHLLQADDFTVFSADYPATKAEIEKMIREKSYLHVWRFDPLPAMQLDNTLVSVTSTTLPGLNGSSVVKEGVYKVTLSYGTGDSKVTRIIDVTIKSSIGKITVGFVNEVGQSIDKNPVKLVLEGKVNTTMDLSEIPEVKKRIADIENEHYRLVKRPDNEKAVAIVGENVEVKYEFTGYLSIVTAPTSLDFKVQPSFIGSKKISEPDVIGANLVISDTRTNKVAWNLKAKITNNLQNEDGSQEMTNVIKYKNATDEVTLNDVDNIIYTPDTITTNEYDITEERWKNRKEGFFLDFPAGSLKALGKYKAQLEITLENAK